MHTKNFSEDKMWTINTAKAQNEAGNAVETYGIQCGEPRVLDITADKTEIEELVGILNSLNASEIHINNFVEDFLGK